MIETKNGWLRIPQATGWAAIPIEAIRAVREEQRESEWITTVWIEGAGALELPGQYGDKVLAWKQVVEGSVPKGK